jgi:hypothetical protein
MKREEGYDIQFGIEATQFSFTSIGPKGAIEKIIQFQFVEENRWNLAFGDMQADDWTDNIISDNDDMRLVLQTVANTIYVFLEKYPYREVYIEPLDRQRKILYNRIFQQKWTEIEPIFFVKGMIEDELFEDYSPHKLYNGFLVIQKN